ncbi:hypothetical protein POM88_034273 [Heracleum sosnowskyi]|uniref:Uncharacterized protein n=1 Tax=Heracleum sosnowskyi TaxID=360622 RepID=A0AAD8HJ73_9APIA|nr:hypothetical protein POM88_034273 [Heracleum sosnowskyi]
MQYWGDEEVQTKESDGALFVKTRKRKEDREYKTDGKVTKFMIENIQNILGTDLSGPSEGVDELLLQGKSHGPTWLIGRCAKPDKRSTSGPTDSQITDLTTKIRQEVVNEMEEKLKQKVQEEVDEKFPDGGVKKLGRAGSDIGGNPGRVCVNGNGGSSGRGDGNGRKNFLSSKVFSFASLPILMLVFSEFVFCSPTFGISFNWRAADTKVLVITKLNNNMTLKTVVAEPIV